MGKEAPSNILSESVVQGAGRHKLRVDRDKGVIYGVKVLGYKSRNGRVYEEAALSDCARLYEGVPVHFGHLTNAYSDRCGAMHNCKATNRAVYGDWHLNKGHVLYEQTMWDAEHNPRNLQLSHEVSRDNAEISISESIEKIKRVHKVNSVAVVTDGATNESLSEGKTEGNPMNLDDLKKAHPDLLEAYATEVKKPLVEETESGKAKVTDLEAKLAEATKLLEEVTKERDQLTGEKKAAERRAFIVKQAQELGAGELTDALVETYMSLPDEGLKTLLEDRAAQVKASAKGKEAPQEPESSPGNGYAREVLPAVFKRK